MAGFRKAQPAQAAIKMSGYGPPGSGKTFSTLLFAEGLAQVSGKRIAYVDTERGTDFYSMSVPARKPHPEAFDFDAIYTRSLVEITKEVKALDPASYGVIVLDSVSHLWDTAIASYSGKKTSAGTIPMYAWSRIKAPYKDLMKWLIDSPFHVFLLGRQANAFEEDPDTGETKSAGVKMRAEGETAYEPHICLHYCPAKNKKTNEQIIQIVAEKDRSGILSGKCIQWPNFQNVIAPVLGILGKTQGATPSDEEAAAHDAEERAEAERQFAKTSRDLANKYIHRIGLADDVAELQKLGKEITPAVKKAMTAQDNAAVRTAWLEMDAKLKGHVVADRQRREEDESALEAARN